MVPGEPSAVWAGPRLAPSCFFSGSPEFHCCLKRSFRKDFLFFSRSLAMSVQIYFGVISSTLLCFSSQRFRRVFQKHIHVPSLFLPLHPPIFFFSVSFYPFFFDLLGFSMDFSLSWHRRAHVAKAGWTCSAATLTLGFCSIHLGCKPEQLQQM